jgi:imidazolonepropionase-like amidohydrolase
MKNNKCLRQAACLFICAFLIPAFPALFGQEDGSIYIKAKKIYTSDGGRIVTGGGILVEGGKITRVDAKARPPKNVKELDFTKNIIIPGMMDAYSHMGFRDEDYDVRTEPPPPYRAPLTGIYLLFYGQQERQPSSLRVEPRFKASDAVYSRDPRFKDFLLEGITTAAIAIPTTNLSGGVAFIGKLGSGSPEDFVMSDTAGAVFAFTGDENVMNRYGDLHKMLRDAQDYRKSWEKFKKDLKKYQDQQIDKTSPPEGKNGEKGSETKDSQEPEEPKKDENHEAILQALDRKVPVLIRASRENEVQAALKIQDEFKVRLVLVGGQEAYKVPQDLLSRKVSVIAGPDVILNKKGKRINYVRELLADGIQVAFCSSSSSGAPLLSYRLAYAVQHGLSRIQALDTVTAHAARIFGLSNRIGSIAAGRDADFVVLDGEPFDLSTRVKGIYIGGRQLFPEEGIQE